VTVVDIVEDDESQDPTTHSIMRRRRAWAPEADSETAAVLRRIAVTPWLVGERDDALIAAVRRNEPAIRDTLARLGWVVVIERDLVRLRKSPPPRPVDWAADGPAPLVCSWFFLLVAAAEAMRPHTGLSQLVTAARACAAEAGLPVTGQIGERRAIVTALRLLDQRGVIEALDGELDVFVRDENAPVLLAVHHSRLAHIIANPGTLDPSDDPRQWLAQVRREDDPARRMRRRLIDDTCAHLSDLDEEEADWLSRRVRSDDGGPLAAAFGLALERRAEGAALVVPDDAFRYPSELGPLAFPGTGTLPHAALLLCAFAATRGLTEGGPGAGWRGLARPDVVGALTELAVDNTLAWRRELADDPSLLCERVGHLLSGLNLVRIQDLRGKAPDGKDAPVWWFAPTTGRWDQASLAEAPRRSSSRVRRENPRAAAPRLFGDEVDNV
jgi:uncharacterized protein (TIGR02678 family)